MFVSYTDQNLHIFSNICYLLKSPKYVTSRKFCVTTAKSAALQIRFRNTWGKPPSFIMIYGNVLSFPRKLEVSQLGYSFGFLAR